MLLGSDKSVEITTKEPENIKISHTSKIAPKFPVINEELGVVNNCEALVCSSRGDN